MNSNYEDEQNNTNYIDSFFKSFNKSTYANLSGLRPYSKEEGRLTTNRNFNKEMDKVINDKEHRDKFYKDMYEFQVKEVEFLKKNNKVDHIKKMNSLLSFKTKGSTYSETHDFDTLKKKEIMDHDFTHHYKKSFLKSYEENKIKSNIVVRK